MKRAKSISLGLGNENLRVKAELFVWTARDACAIIVRVFSVRR